MRISPGARWLLRIGTGLTLLFIYVPLLVIVLYAFNEARIQTWPLPGLTLDWFERAVDNPGDRKSTRLNSSHANISYAVFCLKKKKSQTTPLRPALSLVHISVNLA